MAAKTKAKAKFCVITNEGYGLYCGLVQSYDKVTRTAEVTECRHIARWYGKTGGITSLAVHGLCGPSAGDSRVGAPSPSATISRVSNLFECTMEARATLEAAKQS